jgi:hypothetical protein
MKRIGAILVFSALMSVPAFADDPAPSPAPAATRVAEAPKNGAKKAESKPAAGAANLIVTKDPETGELRHATAAEREKLLGRTPQAAVEHKVVTLPDGTVMVELGDADMSYAVAKRNPDGSIAKSCVHGRADAEKAAAPPAKAPAPATPPADR